MIGIKIITLIFAILSATYASLIMFDQNAQGQTATLTVNYICDENNHPVGTININGFPEGPVSIFRFIQSHGSQDYLGGVTVPSSGTTTFPSEPELMGVQSGDIVTYTVISDPNNNGILDPGEVSASTTVTFSCPQTSSPPQQIQNLINTINNLNIGNSIKNSLTAPLNQAVNLLQDNNPNNDIAACNQLNAFIQQVNAQTQNNSLTQEQSNQLKQAAQSIRNALNCS